MCHSVRSIIFGQDSFNLVFVRCLLLTLYHSSAKLNVKKALEKPSHSISPSEFEMKNEETTIRTIATTSSLLNAWEKALEPFKNTKEMHFWHLFRIRFFVFVFRRHLSRRIFLFVAFYCIQFGNSSGNCKESNRILQLLKIKNGVSGVWKEWWLRASGERMAKARGAAMEGKTKVKEKKKQRPKMKEREKRKRAKKVRKWKTNMKNSYEMCAER